MSIKPKTKHWARSGLGRPSMDHHIVDSSNPRAIHGLICRRFLEHVGFPGCERLLFEISKRPLKGGFDLRLECMMVVVGPIKPSLFTLSLAIFSALCEDFDHELWFNQTLYLRITKL